MMLETTKTDWTCSKDMVTYNKKTSTDPPLMCYFTDEIIANIYEKILEQNDNVLALYTAHHTSWVVPEEVRSHRRVRSLLEADEVANGTALLYNTTEVMFYASASSSYANTTTGIVV